MFEKLQTGEKIHDEGFTAQVLKVCRTPGPTDNLVSLWLAD